MQAISKGNNLVLNRKELGEPRSSREMRIENMGKMVK